MTTPNERPTAAERADRLANSNCCHNRTEEDAYRYQSAMDCPSCVASEIRSAERAATLAERERAAKIAEDMSINLGSAAEGQNDPEFSQLISGEMYVRRVATALRADPEEKKE